MSIKETIKDEVRQRVVDGTYTYGAQLSGVVEVCDEFDCSTATAGYTMRSLVDEGYVVGRQGVGYLATETLPVLTADDLTSRQDA